ncbi:MAG: gliding motility-associated C-terminal domain-containing protein [Muribaculaceae bacterium]|nr:gliding motility-associated C-terminal domain-containing protein [Muribaculaceae bacterium]
MKHLRILLLSLPAVVSATAFADSTAQISGSDYQVIEISPEANTGLDNIFTVYNTVGCSLSFKAQNGYTANVFRFSNLGGGYAEEVTNLDRSTDAVSLPLQKDDMGYIFEEGTSRYYCWVVNYANHYLHLNSAAVSPDSDCSYSIITIDGDASPITYYTINGQPRTLSRQLKVEYLTQEFDSDMQAYKTVDAVKEYESIGMVLSITPPAYCSTFFTISGDRFLRQWGMEQVAETSTAQPVAVECSTEAVQDFIDKEEGSNVMNGDDSVLGGSAPAQITFKAYTTEGVLHYEWQLDDTPDFDNPDYRFYQKDLDYTFNEEGTFYLRFIGSNADGTCETFSDTYTVAIGASALECPNAFSPNGDGVNDIWKVSYRSLIDFNCEIFNRNGQRIYSFTDPTDGWDGTWHGKKVKPGVYYYVIIATGADGKKYKKSGDINIINSINYGTSSGDGYYEDGM